MWPRCGSRWSGWARGWRITADPADLDEAEWVILPGVGAAGYAMQRLNALGLVEALRRFKRPLLGVCLGQQLLFETSDEDGGVSTCWA